MLPSHRLSLSICSHPLVPWLPASALLPITPHTEAKGCCLGHRADRLTPWVSLSAAPLPWRRVPTPGDSRGVFQALPSPLSNLSPSSPSATPHSGWGPHLVLVLTVPNLGTCHSFSWHCPCRYTTAGSAGLRHTGWNPNSATH